MNIRDFLNSLNSVEREFVESQGSYIFIKLNKNDFLENVLRYNCWERIKRLDDTFKTNVNLADIVGTTSFRYMSLWPEDWSGVLTGRFNGGRNPGVTGTTTGWVPRQGQSDNPIDLIKVPHKDKYIIDGDGNNRIMLSKHTRNSLSQISTNVTSSVPIDSLQLIYNELDENLDYIWEEKVESGDVVFLLTHKNCEKSVTLKIHASDSLNAIQNSLERFKLLEKFVFHSTRTFTDKIKLFFLLS